MAKLVMADRLVDGEWLVRTVALATVGGQSLIFLSPCK
jgi:hypothetical protein